MLAFGKKIYVHGGMAERDIHGDLYTLDTGEIIHYFTKVKPSLTQHCVLDPAHI